MLPATVIQMMPFVGRKMQATAAAASAALSRGDAVEEVPCGLSLLVDTAEAELEGLESLPSRKSRSLKKDQHWRCYRRCDLERTLVRDRHPEHLSVRHHWLVRQETNPKARGTKRQPSASSQMSLRTSV